MSDKSKIKVGDYVQIRIVGFGSRESAYQIESIEGEDYTIVQMEGSYKHRMKVKKEKIKKI